MASGIVTTRLWLSQRYNKTLGVVTANKAEENWPPQKLCSDLVLPGTVSEIGHAQTPTA